MEGESGSNVEYRVYIYPAWTAWNRDNSGTQQKAERPNIVYHGDCLVFIRAEATRPKGLINPEGLGAFWMDCRRGSDNIRGLKKLDIYFRIYMNMQKVL